MKKLRLAELKGFSSIFVLVGMLLVAIALPVATKLVQQSQENRSNAAAPSSTCNASSAGTIKCNDSALWKCNGTSYGSGSSAYKIYSWGKSKTCDYGCRTSTTCAVCKEGTNKGCSSGKTCSNGTCVAQSSGNCSYNSTTVNKGSSACVGKVLVTCSSTGNRSVKDCKYGCSSGKCKCSYDNTIYTNNTVRCWSNKLHICTNGDWKDGNSCKSGQKCNNSGNDCVSSDTTVDVTKVEFDKMSITVTPGNSVSITATVSPSNATHKTLTWTTTNSSVASVNSSGVIKGIKAGTAVVKAAVSNGKYATVSVTVKSSSYYFYDSSSRSCKSNSDYASITACEVSHNKCYDSESACKSANVLPQCTDKGGYCVTSSGSMTSGIKCNISSSATGLAHTTEGTTNPSYLCSTNNYVCCMPSGSAYVGKCTTYPKGVTSRPDTTCSSGKVVWLDETGYNGDYDWKCMGSNDSSSSDDDLNCKARKVVDGTATSSNSRACGEKGGICANFGTVLNAGDGCRVAAQLGTVITGLCPGNNQTVCCLTGTGTTTPSTSSGGNNNGSGGNNNGGSPSTPNVPATGITLDPTSLSVAVGASATITATVAPDNATDTTVTWSSGTESVATVSNGVVTGKSVGTAVITAKTSNGKTATASASVFAAGTNRISFKFSLRGIKPSYTNSSGTVYNCFDKLGKLAVDVVNSPSNTYQIGLSTDFSVVSGETNDKGDQVFKVSALALDSSKFASVGTYNYLKVKGPFHLKRRMCLNGQNAKLSETTTCNISLASDTVYDFSEYTLLAGDVNADGVINSVDYSYVKTRYDASADISCGREGDLNMDGVVNALDGNLIKESLSSKDDE